VSSAPWRQQWRCFGEGRRSSASTDCLGTKAPVVGFVDADGCVEPAECAAVLAEIAASADLDAAIGSRVKMLGKTVARRTSRHVMGRVFATTLSAMYAMPVYDSQCGCKFFRGDSVRPLLPHVTSRQWLWDTELLILLYRRGGRIREIPVSWSEAPGSKLSLWHSLITVPYELWAFKRSLARKQL
jgi:hypothetical protein